MSTLPDRRAKQVIRLDDPELASELACQRERANWVATRSGLPGIGSKLVNQHGIEWVVQGHAPVSTYDSLHRLRQGEVLPELDMYPVIASTNFSPKLMEFFHAIDRCTTKTFAMVDTMPGRRRDGHVPGGNHIDTVCHPATNVIFLDAARVHESIVAHELGHAWVQYVDECEDLRTMKDSADPQRMRHVGFIQSFVLDLKVNDLLRRKGFDMSPIEEDQARSVQQLAESLERGYVPSHPREEVFMALLVADQIIGRQLGRRSGLVRFDSSLDVIRSYNAPMLTLAESVAERVSLHGYDSHAAITTCIDECLIVSFEHCGDCIDLDRELLTVNPEEPNIDKFPLWLPQLPPKTKCKVGKHMARNDISSEWSQTLEPTITACARVTFTAPEHDRVSQIILPERLGPPTRYSDMPETIAELLALKHLNQTGCHQLHGGPPFKCSDLHHVPEPRTPSIGPKIGPSVGEAAPLPQTQWSNRLPRPYMAGYGRWLTQARLREQLAGEHPYAYAECNPVIFTDPSGLDVYRCKRALRDRDYNPSCPVNLKTPAEHWWIYMDDQFAPCQSIGYGPGGRYGHSGNLGAGYGSDVTCTKVSTDPAVEKCVCDLAAKVAKGWVLCGSTWVDNTACHTYNFVTHNCQDYTICLLHSCGVGGSKWDPFTWEWDQQGVPPYWPPIIRRA